VTAIFVINIQIQITFSCCNSIPVTSQLIHRSGGTGWYKLSKRYAVEVIRYAVKVQVNSCDRVSSWWKWFCCASQQLNLGGKGGMIKQQVTIFISVCNVCWYRGADKSL